jgi:hypothetical protein
MKLAFILSSQNSYFLKLFPHNATVLGGLNIFINYIFQYINVEVALYHSNKWNKYFYKIYFSIY